MANANRAYPAALIGILLTICFGQTASATADRLNIILLVSDDQGYGDMGRHGNPVLKTPNMDRLHDESVRLTDFSVSPTCAPTRAALMTGMQEFHSGVTHTLSPRRSMNPRVTTLPQTLTASGYATGLFGKWHLGHEPGYRPEERGFDTTLTSPQDSQRSHYDPELLLNGEPRVYTGYRTDIFFNEAMKWITANRDGPFFCYIPTYNAHGPHVVPDQYSAPYEGDLSEKTTKFFGMLANLDMNIGRLLDYLETENLADNTVVVFLNDNGGTMGVDVFNAGMRGCKATIWRGGTRAFCFWRWPGHWTPRDDSALSGHVDVMPTLLELSGAAVSGTVRESLEGISLVGRLADPDTPWPDRMLFQHVSRWGDGLADEHQYVNCGVRWRSWHLIRSTTCGLGCMGECKVFRKAVEGEPLIYTQDGHYHYAQTPRGRWTLYDLSADPAEDHDLAESHPEVVERMTGAYDAWWEAARAGMIHD